MKIPKGWRKLRRGTQIESGDKFYGVNTRKFYRSHTPGYCAGCEPFTDFTYIRRIKRKARK